MKTINPLPEFRNGEDVLLDGTYEAVFAGCEVIERPKFEDPSEAEPALKLLFEVPSAGVTLAKFDGLKFGMKSNLRKDLKAMTGPEFTTEVFRDRDALWEHLQGLCGRTYLVTCEPNEAGTYTRITGIVPAQNAAGPARKKLNGASRAGRGVEGAAF